MPSSVGQIPVRKKRPSLVRRPLKQVRRRLFDPPSSADIEEFLSGLESRELKQFTIRYNFDPQKEEPLPGRFEWTPLRLELPRSSTTTSTITTTTTTTSATTATTATTITSTTTSPESSTEVQKEELVDSTMSPS